VAIACVDEVMLREPRLLVPGMQPLGPVRKTDKSLYLWLATQNGREVENAAWWPLGASASRYADGISAPNDADFVTTSYFPLKTSDGEGTGDFAVFWCADYVNTGTQNWQSNFRFATRSGDYNFGGLSCGPQYNEFIINIHSGYTTTEITRISIASLATYRFPVIVVSRTNGNVKCSSPVAKTTPAASTHDVWQTTTNYSQIKNDAGNMPRIYYWGIFNRGLSDPEIDGLLAGRVFDYLTPA
jgi:hypothetical protein